MIELRYNTQQTIVIGPIVPADAKLVRSDWSVVDISGRMWVPVTGISNHYFLLMNASDLNFFGHMKIMPVGMFANVITQNMWDLKYDVFEEWQNHISMVNEINTKMDVLESRLPEAQKF